jgi:hypothetical protein
MIKRMVTRFAGAATAATAASLLLTVPAQAAATVPFDFTLTGVWSWDGRIFTSGRSSVCTDIEVHSVQNPSSGKNFRVELFKDNSVLDDFLGRTGNIPQDGVARSYCWSGVPTGHNLYFHYGFDNPGPGGSFEKVDGHGRVRYP